MSDTFRIILVPLCLTLVLFSLIVMTVFRRLISHGDQMTNEQLKKTKLFAFILLAHIIISLLVISVYLLIRFMR
ncbi:MAG: hypothetical protein IKX74_04685 [Erysipelotrichaceae bacterium]|nr:hypothetical protein [Erysipelotrichaceae bacterium]MBR5048916.1 hypothetical protein [Erysipelotrichaceae bacterium]